jgi:hypothetical protein
VRHIRLVDQGSNVILGCSLGIAETSEKPHLLQNGYADKRHPRLRSKKLANISSDVLPPLTPDINDAMAMAVSESPCYRSFAEDALRSRRSLARFILEHNVDRCMLPVQIVRLGIL